MNRLNGVFLLCCLGALSLRPTLITAQPVGGTTTTFPGGSTCNSGPSSGTVAGFNVSANGAACYPYSDFFNLGANGTWHMSLVGVDSGSTLITIDLGGLYSSVGGFVNYFPGASTPTIAAIAADGTTLLQSFDLSVSAPISTGVGSLNDGAFRGIDLGGLEIRYFQFGGGMVVHDITLEAVPEPSTALMALCGLAALALSRRLRRTTRGSASR